MQVQIIDPDHFPPKDVDYLLIKQITPQQKHALRAVAGSPIAAGRVRFVYRP